MVEAAQQVTEATAPEISLTTMLIVAVIAICGGAFVGWKLTELAKDTVLAKMADRLADSKKDPIWWTILLGGISVVVGFGLGCLVGSVEWSWVYGGVLGATGGATPAFWKKVIKIKAKGLAE
jgi:hypothetical protein